MVPLCSTKLQLKELIIVILVMQLLPTESRIFVNALQFILPINVSAPVTVFEKKLQKLLR